MKSPKEVILDDLLRQRVQAFTEAFCPQDHLPVRLMEELLADAEVKAIQDYANTVSITRIGLNDHGPVHMKIVCKNAIKILGILHEAGVPSSLEREGSGTLADSLSAIILASLLHDAGMTIGRTGHELYSGIICYGLITRVLEKLLPGDEHLVRRTAIRSVAIEGIIGHMGTHPIHSLEAGIILVSDGCDMTKGRARIILENLNKPMEGDIHKYSASSIEKVILSCGREKPLCIEITMRERVGFFQVEEVLIPKIHASTIRQYIELYAGVLGEEAKKYI